MADRTSVRPKAVASERAAVRVMRAGPAALQEYEKFAQTCAPAPPQSPLWTEAWSAHSGEECVLAIFAVGGRDVLAIPMEIIRSGPFRIGRFMGGRHANGNFSAAASGMEFTPAMLGEFFRAFAKTRPDVDLLHFERQLSAHAGQMNPLFHLPKIPSPNIALAADISQGFDALIERLGGKRRRKKHRQQTRKLEAAGGFRIIDASTPPEVKRLLEAFFAMKALRFPKKGIEDVFARPPVRAFFEALFNKAAGSGKPFMLTALEVGGVIRAVTGSSVTEGRMICEFGAITEDELAGASPGDFLFYKAIERAAQQQFQLYDFSVGDEPYKRQWCEVEITHFDTVIPLTPKGRLLAGKTLAVARVKRWIKSNAFAWTIMQKWRARNAKPLPAATDE